jgi:hypothetical protein
MNVIRFPVERLQRLFEDQKVVTMPQLKAALGTRVNVTVFRKLSTLPYRSSYSHCGAYYTLDSLAQYDDLGLWSYQGIHFSRHGTLLKTTATLVTEALAGYLVGELEATLHVALKDPLRQLVQAQRLSRRQWQGRYLYCASDRARRQEQWAARAAQPPQGDDVAAAKALFYSLLDEQQRRLYAGLESLQVGHGGATQMAEFYGLDVDTVARGQAELLRGQVLRGRVRRPGAGRVAVEKKRPKS